MFVCVMVLTPDLSVAVTLLGSRLSDAPHGGERVFPLVLVGVCVVGGRAENRMRALEEPDRG